MAEQLELSAWQAEMVDAARTLIAEIEARHRPLRFDKLHHLVKRIADADGRFIERPEES